MKKIVFAFVFSLIALGAFAQNKALFLDNEPWEKVMKKAKKADKMVFVDCYASWCGPCKHLMNDVFPQKEVSEYLEANFVCAKYDIEQENGTEFTTLYPNRIFGVPTMFIIDAQGNLLQVIRGAREADDLLSTIKEGLAGMPLYELEQKYQQGKRDLDFMKRYLWMLESAGDQSMREKAAGDYAASFPIDSLLNQDIWDMVRLFIYRDPYSPEYRFVVEHLDEFAQVEKDYYRLENVLYDIMNFEVNLLNSSIFKTMQEMDILDEKNADTVRVLKQKVNQLLELTQYPVKGFTQKAADLLVVQAILNHDVNRVYSYFTTFEDCNFIIDVVWYREAVYQYLIKYITDQRRVQNCVNRLLAYQNRLEPESKASLDGVIAGGKEKLKVMEELKEFLNLGE